MFFLYFGEDVKINKKFLLRYHASKHSTVIPRFWRPWFWRPSQIGDIIYLVSSWAHLLHTYNLDFGDFDFGDVNFARSQKSPKSRDDCTYLTGFFREIRTKPEIKGGKTVQQQRIRASLHSIFYYPWCLASVGCISHSINPESEKLVCVCTIYVLLACNKPTI